MSGRLIAGEIIEENDFVLLFSNELMVTPVDRIQKDYYTNICNFRDLLLIAIRIRTFAKQNYCIPNQLSSIDTKSDILGVSHSMHIDYIAHGDEWQLRYAGPRINQSVIRFNVYIPSLKMSELNKWPYSGCINYSSDFERKRKTLYMRGKLYENDSIWSCEFVNGKIVKPAIRQPH